MARLVRRILEDKSRQLVHIVKFTLPATGVASTLDDALLDEHINLGKMAVLTADVLLDELIQ